MHGFRWLLLPAVLLALVPAAVAASPARASYERALARERQVVSAHAEAAPSLASLQDLVRTFEAIARRYPTSGYADNALLKAAEHAEAIFARTGRDADRDRARRYYDWLAREYPSSSLARRAARSAAALAQPAPRQNAALSRKAAQAPSADSRATARQREPIATTPDPSAPLVGPQAKAGPASPPTSAESPTPPASTVAPVSIRDIRRDVLDDLLRVTIELDDEVAFRHERLDGPSRVFFDLQATRLSTSLRGVLLQWPDDVVRQVRFGQPAAGTTRVVLDLEGAGRHSVFTLYNPFRVIVDVERKPGVARGNAGPESPAPGATAVTTSRTGAQAPAAPASAAPPSIPVPLDIDLEPAPAAPAVDPREIDGRDLGLAEDHTVNSRVLEAPGTGAPPGPAPADAATPRPVAGSPARRPTAPASAPKPAAEAATAPQPPSANARGGFSLARQLGLGVSRIVIDPGHGGRDPGAIKGDLTEAELVLDIALRMERLLLARPGFEVVLTRRDDSYVALEERTAMANRVKADLFLSIHANASRNPQAEGVETYILNFATNPEAEAVAARENASAAHAMHNLPDIVRAIATNNKIDESRDFARMVQAALVKRLSTKTRRVRDLGVKQAPFVVLIGAGMPSVLAEISFLTNPREAQLLRSDAYRQRIAEALTEAVASYQRSLKAVGTLAAQ